MYLILMCVALLFNFIKLSSFSLELDFKRQECLSDSILDVDQEHIELVFPGIDLSSGLLLKVLLLALQSMIFVI